MVSFKGKLFQNESGEIEVKKFKTGYITIRTTGEFVIDSNLKKEFLNFLVLVESNKLIKKYKEEYEENEGDEYIEEEFDDEETTEKRRLGLFSSKKRGRPKKK